MVSDHYLFGHNSDYTFEFFLNGSTLATDESIRVDFPCQWDLYVADGNSSYTCSTTSLDTTSLTATASTWNTDTDCSTGNSNRVELGASSTATTLASGLEFTWSISGVGNPEWGWDRTAATSWDFDVSDTDVMGNYSKWSNKFVLSTHDLSDKNVVQKSYDNLNAAYLGFTYQYD